MNPSMENLRYRDIEVVKLASEICDVHRLVRQYITGFIVGVIIVIAGIVHGSVLGASLGGAAILVAIAGMFINAGVYGKLTAKWEKLTGRPWEV